MVKPNFELPGFEKQLLITLCIAGLRNMELVLLVKYLCIHASSYVQKQFEKRENPKETRPKP